SGVFLPPVPLSSGGLLFRPTGLSVVKFTPTVHTDTGSPTVSINGAPISSPEGTAISLTSSVLPAGTYTYAWTVTKNGNPFATGSTSSLTFTPNDMGTYVVTVSV